MADKDGLHIRDGRPGSGLEWSYFHGACDEPLCGLNLPQLLESAAMGRGDGALYKNLEYSQTITAKELFKQADDIAKSLLSCGVTKGDVVMLLAVDDLMFYAVMHGVFAIGAVFFNPFLYPPKDVALQSILEACKPKIIICRPNDREMTETALEKGGRSCGQIVCVPNPENEDTKETPAPINGYTGASFLKKGESVSDEVLALSKNKVSQDDNAWLLSSTGTMGEPKQVYISHHTLVNFAKFSTIRRKPHTKPEIEAWASPAVDDVLPVSQSLCLLYHWDIEMTGIVLPSAFNYYNDNIDELMRIIELEKITSLSMFPFMIVGILGHASREKYDLSTLRTGLLVSQAVSTETCQKISQLFPEFVVGYAATEFFSATTTSPQWSTTTHFTTTAGYAMPHVEVKIVDEEGIILPVGTTGELWLRGWPMFNGYVSKASTNDNAVDTAGWFHTGDMGKMDATGHVELMGRKADCIRFKRRGDVIYPKVIENAVKTHQSVQDVKVIGLEDDSLGSNVVACVILVESQKVSSEDLKTFISSKLTEKDEPDYLLFFDRFPKVGTRAKISRPKLLEMVKKRLLADK